MEGDTSAKSYPQTVNEVFMDFKGRRAGILKALTCDLHKFFLHCDPSEGNLCLYAFADGNWEVNPPHQELPTLLPEPATGINFYRDGMLLKQWLSFVATHSDSWLVSVAYYLCMMLDKAGKQQVFDMINDLPTVLEMVERQEILHMHEVTEKKQLQASTIVGKEEKSVGYQKKQVLKVRSTKSQPLLSSSKHKEEVLEDRDSIKTFCGACGLSYKSCEFWIGCGNCDEWFHGKCVSITPARAEIIKSYKCPSCRKNSVRTGWTVVYSH